MQITIDFTGPKIRMPKSRRSWALVLAVPVVLASTLSGCGCGSSSDTNGLNVEKTTSQQQLTYYEQVQPAPLFTSPSVMRGAMTEIEAIQVFGEKTTTFFWLPGVGHPINSCPSYGMPIANTAQLTNPVQAVQVTHGSYGNTAVTEGNIDPNGTYPPVNSSGTYVLCEMPDGKPYAHYYEGYADTYGVGAYWDPKLGQIVVNGVPAMPVCKIGIATVKGKRIRATVCSK